MPTRAGIISAERVVGAQFDPIEQASVARTAQIHTVQFCNLKFSVTRIRAIASFGPNCIFDYLIIQSISSIANSDSLIGSATKPCRAFWRAFADKLARSFVPFPRNF